MNGIALIGEFQCASASSDKSVKVWDIRKHSSPLNVLLGHTGKVKCIKYTEAGKKICTGGEDGVDLWRSDNFAHIRSETHDEPVVSLYLDEESVAYGGGNGHLKFYDFAPHR